MKARALHVARALVVVAADVDAVVQAPGLALARADLIVGSSPVRAPVLAVVALGANLGDAPASVRAAMADLGRLPQTRCLRTSSLFRTAPLQAQGPDFINAVALLETTLTAPDLLHALQALENAAGRERPFANAPRTLDLDLVLYGDAHMSSPALTLPHPRWRERAFVLLPLCEVAPARVSDAMLAAVADQRIERWG